MKKILIATLIGSFVFGISTVGSAAVLVNTGPLPVAAVQQGIFNYAPGSTLVAHIAPTPFSFSLIKGTLEQWVYRDPSDGNLIFAYQVINTGGVNDNAFRRVTATNFAGWTTWMAYEAPGVAPLTFDRFSNSTLGWDYTGGNGITVGGQSSAILWAKTDAGSCVLRGNTSIIDGGAANVTTYCPVPEPTSMLLLGIGLIGLAGGKVRKRFKA